MTADAERRALLAISALTVLSGAGQAGAAGAVAIGVKRGVFSPLALTVASFDALSGALALRHLMRR